MITRNISMGLTAVLIAAMTAVGTWHHGHQVLVEARAQLVSDELQPIADMLKANQALIRELQAEPFKEQDLGILESYLAKIRRDGVPKHVDMKQMLDQLAENNTAIVTLVKAYAPHVKVSAYTLEADKFRDYASAWRDRWNSVMEVFMAGGNFARSGVPFPKDFPAAVDAEMAADLRIENFGALFVAPDEMKRRIADNHSDRRRSGPSFSSIPVMSGHLRSVSFGGTTCDLECGARPALRMTPR